MQSAPNLKVADPHDIFAIESVLAAHAQKSPPIAPESERVAPPIVPQSRAGASQAHAAPPVQVAPPVLVGPPAPSTTEPTFDIRDVPANDVEPTEIKLDGLGPLSPRPTPRWAKRLFIAGLGLVGAVTAAGWQHYGDQAKAMANEWVPHAVLAALSPAANTTAEQPIAAAEPAATADQSANPAVAPAATEPPAVVTAAPSAATATSAESAQLQTMAQDLATMGAQVEELKATIAQLKASQAQMTRELAKASEAKTSEAKASEVKAPEPRVAAAAPPTRPVAPPPVRRPKPPAHTSSSYVPSYSPSPAPVAAAAPLPLVQPPPAAPARQTLADDGQPVVRPPMPLR